MKLYVRVRRDKNHDGDKLLRVTTHKKKPKKYSFVVNDKR